MKVVLIIGGAVSGSTAAKKLTENGIRCIVVDQNRLPYGKIEDGLPRWHDKQRNNEYSKIDEIMGHNLVDFVPSTKIGREISQSMVLKIFLIFIIKILLFIGLITIMKKAIMVQK